MANTNERSELATTRESLVFAGGSPGRVWDQPEVLFAANMQGSQAQNDAPSNWWVLLVIVAVVALVVCFTWMKSRATRGTAGPPDGDIETTAAK